MNANTGRKKLFGCPVCGFKVTGTEDNCPRCGKKYDEGTRFECPFCGEPVDPRSPRCPSCSVSYEEFHLRGSDRDPEESVDSLLTEIIRHESEQVRREDKHLSCPKCSWLLAGNEERCPKCGERFEDQVSYQCPICAALVRADAVKCTDCGTLFVEEESPPLSDDVEEEPEEPEPPALRPVADRALTADRAMTAPRPALGEADTGDAPLRARPKVELRALEPAEPETKPRQRKLRTRKIKKDG